MCCDRDNIGSAKSIINNGGILENEGEEDGHIEQRYWIKAFGELSGVREVIRTPDLPLRRRSLYPAELRRLI